MFNSSAFLEVNNLSEDEKKEAHEYGPYITKGNVTE